MSGPPKTVILNGKIIRTPCAPLRLTAADLMEALRRQRCLRPPGCLYAVVETQRQSLGGSAPKKGTGHPRRPWGKGKRAQATISFVLDGQVLAENLTTCGKDAAWLERTAQANSLLLEEILILAGNDTEDYFLLKKEPRKRRGFGKGVRHETYLCLHWHRSPAAGGSLLQQLPGTAIRRGYLR